MAIQVTIKGAYERREVNAGTPKATTVQNIVVQDATGEIRCSLWGHGDASEFKGKQFVIHSNKAFKGPGFAGISVKDGTDQNGQQRRELQISKSATIQFVEVYNDSKLANAPASQPGASKAPTSPGPLKDTAPGTATRQPTAGPVTLEKLANFWEWCYVEAEKRQKKFGFSDVMKQSCIGSLFIQGMKERIHGDLSEPAPYARVDGATVSGAVTAGITDGPDDGSVPF